MGIKSIHNTIISKSVSGKKLARQIDNQRFAFSVRIITGKRSDVYGDLMAFIVKQRSGKENFTIIPPEIEDARGNETGTVLVNGVHAVGDTTIACDAFAGDGAGRFKAGDFLKFASHTKVYMVVEDATSSSNASTVTVSKSSKYVFLLFNVCQFGKLGVKLIYILESGNSFTPIFVGSLRRSPWV